MTMPRESSQHEPNAGEADEGESGSLEVFIVLGQAVPPIDPRDSAFHDPGLELPRFRGYLIGCENGVRGNGSSPADRNALPVEPVMASR